MTDTAAAPAKERWTLSWKHLYDEVVTSGLCTGCAGCVIACPHDVLGYDDSNGVYKPQQIEDYGGPADCSHGDKACTSCTRACPRFRPPARSAAGDARTIDRRRLPGCRRAADHPLH